MKQIDIKWEDRNHLQIGKEEIRVLIKEKEGKLGFERKEIFHTPHTSRVLHPNLMNSKLIS